MKNIIAVLTVLMLAFPPSVYAKIDDFNVEDLGQFEIQFLNAGKTFNFEQAEAGIFFADTEDKALSSLIPTEFLEGVALSELEVEEYGTEGLSKVSVNLHFPNRIEKSSMLSLRGVVDSQNNQFTGSIFYANGELFQDIIINLKESSANRVVIVITVTIAVAATIGALGCAIATLLNDCAGDCNEACGTNGVLSYTTAPCGGCTCTCNDPTP